MSLVESLRRLARALCAAALAACASPDVDSGSRWSTVTGTAGDTIIVRTSGIDTLAALATVGEELSIGAVEGADEYLLGDIAALVVGDSGEIYAYDRQVPALRMYDRSGRYLRTIGGQGDGPGEYRMALGLSVLPDSRVLLHDLAGGRVNVYTRDGEPAGEWVVGAVGPPLIMQAVTAQTLGVDTAGHVLVTSMGVPGADGGWTVRRLRYSTRGELIDTVRPPDYGYRRPTLQAVSGERSSLIVPPYTPDVVWTMTATGAVAAGLSSQYRIDVRRPDGTVLRIEAATLPVGVPPEERDQRIAEVTARMRRVDPGWTWSGPGFPAVKPFFKELYGAPDHRLWVLLHGPSERQEAPAPAGAPPGPRISWIERPLWDVFDRDGAYLGRVRPPDNATFLFMRGDHAWGVARDSLDVQTIRRYRITFPGR
jgi:hypothetical protein